MLIALCLVPLARADSIVVFNEVHYHPPTNEASLEWVELHNQLAVDVDLSGWTLSGGIDFLFPEGSVIAGKGYCVIAAAPADLAAVYALTNVVGPFTNRLSNSGEKLELYNNNHRLMDQVAYGVDGDWPVGPDGSGVTLAKRDEDDASPPATSWTVSAQVGGTPGRRNFPLATFEVTNSIPVTLAGTWKYTVLDASLDAAWRQREFNDTAWATGQGLFRAGNVTPAPGAAVSVPTMFSTGLGTDGAVLSPGSSDPHYQLTLSAESTPPPPAIAATVILNHPAWLANDALSTWIGVRNPGELSVAAGAYYYRTTFSLEGFNATTARLTFNIGVDNELQKVLFNGVSQAITYAGFSSLSPAFTITNGFLAGTNVLEFQTLNADSSANPAGFRVKMAGTAVPQLPLNTTLPAGKTNYCFRTRFTLGVTPQLAALRLSTLVADGAAFYVNGTEVLRLNLPAGALTPATRALTNVPNPATLGPFALPTAALLTGTNVLAVELYSASSSTNDVLFGAELSVSATNLLAPPPITVAFNEIASATNSPEFFVELANSGSAELDLAGCVLACRGGTTNREFVFPSQKLAPGALASFSKTTLGFGADPGDRLFLYGPSRDQVLDAVVADARPHARWPDGSGPWAFPSTLTPGTSNQIAFHRDVVINEILYHPPALPPVPAAFATNLLLTISNSWRYHCLGQDLGSAWRTASYDDSAWPIGPALFYNTASTLPAPKNTELPVATTNGARITTWYFRTTFQFAGGTNRAQLILRPIVDDGAVYYLNGTEIFRQNMPTGAVTYPTLATPGVATPAYTGPFTVAVSNLVDGANWLAVEVHQYAATIIPDDMAFGLEVALTGQWVPALPARESPEAWVELFNRGTNTIDLAGWRLGDGVDFRFASGTTLSPGGFLVVAKDVGYMQSNFPAIAVVGPFTNRLSHKGELLTLRDAADNIANQVRYYDSRPWPGAADGYSSLELRDPWADNTKAEAWAASDESARVGWSDYTYRAVANNVLGPTIWNEFVLGLIDAGECLLDDLHVIESPGSSPVELLQNGSFETGLTAWRALGTHGAARVEVDPSNPANHVLHLIASGPTDHLHNHLETTFTNNRAVVNGREYQVSFRAKWLSGNNRLNTRLYFNRVAKTTALPLPAHLGTPGAPNSTLTTNLGPTFEAFGHSPIVPPAGQPITISVNAGDPQGVQSVTLWTALNGGTWQSQPMPPGAAAASTGYSNYVAILPGQVAGTLVQFYVQATDRRGAVATYPARGANSRALLRVQDGKALMSQLHRFSLLMLPADANLLHTPTNVMSNDRLGLTVVYDERQVFYDVGVHLQSSERGRNDTSRVGFTVRFNADHLFRGEQNGFTLDRSGGYSNLGGDHDEILLWHAVNHAGDLLGLDCDLAQLFAPRSQEDGTGLMRFSAFDSDYFDHQFPNGGDGASYKLELIYFPTTTTTGDPQAPKLPQPDDVLNVDFQDWGADAENYRWIFLRENQTDLDDYSQVIAVNQALSLTGSPFETQTARLIDADQYLRTLAFKTFTGDVDTYTAGLNHNWKIYFRPDTGQMLGLLWDMDFTFVQSVNASFPGTSSPNTYRFVTLPNNYRRYCNHLLDILTTTVNTAHLTPWAARYAGLLGQNWSGAVSYLQQRASFIRSALPQGGTFAITSNGGRSFATTNSQVTLAGTAPLAVHAIAVNGVDRPLTWSSLTNWTLTVPLPARVNLLVAQGLDNAGKPITNASASITVTNLGAPAAAPVVINEWMADNAGPGGFADPVDNTFQDWFELYNPNNLAVDLSGYYLTDTLSQPTKWQVPANTTIPPRGFRLVWADGDTAQNGQGTNGDLHASFQLSRSGEALGLYAPDGTPQHTVTFGAQAQNVSQGLYPDGNTNGIYSMADWSPRAANRLGTPPAPQMGAVALQPNGQLSFQASVTPNRTYQAQYKVRLPDPNWIPLGSPQVATGPLLTITDLLTNQPNRFYRIVLLP